MENHIHDVVVVGAGPGGLSAGWELIRAGFKPLILERTAAVGDVWRNHYDGLKLNTGRVMSQLPGGLIPRSAGAWPTRDDLVQVLESMPARGGYKVVTGAEVIRIERSLVTGLWLINLADGRTYRTPAVVVATGGSRVPFRPMWEGEDSFKGRILHSSEFKNAKDFKDQRVLVVGCGNSAAEIASRLTEYASEVICSVRTPPHLLPKSVFGVPMAGWGLILRYLPARISDTLLFWVQRLAIGNLSRFGLPLPTTRLSIKFRQTNVVPTLYASFSNDVRAGRIRILGKTVRFNDNSVVVDEHVATQDQSYVKQISFPVDSVIAGTGFRTGLEDLIPIAGLFDTNGIPKVTGEQESSLAPGLYFIGQSNPLSGQLREIRIEAVRIAQKLKKSLVTHKRPMTDVNMDIADVEQA
jgi:putative flavoprotein involved in K+ transport